MKPISKKIERKSFSEIGKWIEKPRRSEVLVCSVCGGKYIKTRPHQNACIRCLVRTESRR